MESNLRNDCLKALVHLLSALLSEGRGGVGGGEAQWDLK